MLENELTFLVKKLPQDYLQYPSSEIKQGFISGLPSPLRIRKSGEKYTMTKKTPVNLGDASRYNETEIELSEDEFDKFWPICTSTLSKTRIVYPLESGLTAEIDLFHGLLEGFSYVEVEFPDEKHREDFVLPDWFGADISQEDWVANSELSKLSFDQVKEIIS